MELTPKIVDYNRILTENNLRISLDGIDTRYLMRGIIFRSHALRSRYVIRALTHSNLT